MKKCYYCGVNDSDLVGISGKGSCSKCRLIIPDAMSPALLVQHVERLGIDEMMTDDELLFIENFKSALSDRGVTKKQFMCLASICDENETYLAE